MFLYTTLLLFFISIYGAERYAIPHIITLPKAIEDAALGLCCLAKTSMDNSQEQTVQKLYDSIDDFFSSWQHKLPKKHGVLASRVDYYVYNKKRELILDEKIIKQIFWIICDKTTNLIDYNQHTKKTIERFLNRSIAYEIDFLKETNNEGDTILEHAIKKNNHPLVAACLQFNSNLLSLNNSHFTCYSNIQLDSFKQLTTDSTMLELLNANYLPSSAFKNNYQKKASLLRNKKIKH